MRNDIWEYILKQINYCPGKDTVITAEQIKSFGKTFTGKPCQFEPRLLCYMDSEQNLPEILKKNQLNVLAIKNGSYLLTHTRVFHTLEYEEQIPEKITFEPISRLVTDDGEAGIINILLRCRIFEKLLGQNLEHLGFLNGRRKLGPVKIKFPEQDITIDGAQFETDFSCLTQTGVIIAECKRSKRLSFNLRQLYYPFRYLYERIQETGETREIFVFFICQQGNDCFLFQYTFPEPENMFNLVLVRFKSYQVISRNKLDILN